MMKAAFIETGARGTMLSSISTSRLLSRNHQTCWRASSRLLSSARPLPNEEYYEEGNHDHRKFTNISTSTTYQSHPSFRVVQRPSTFLPLPEPETTAAVLKKEKQYSRAVVEKHDEDENVTLHNLSPSHLKYSGNMVIPITSKLELIKPQDDAPQGVWPVYRLMDENGDFRNCEHDGKIDHCHPFRSDTNYIPRDKDDLDSFRFHLAQKYPFQAQEIAINGLLHSSEFAFSDTESENTLLRAHRHIVRLREMDTILQNAQRQGRISFYMTCTGEEAIHIGAASALNHKDHVFMQYREQGLFMWRGFTLDQFANQCFSNDMDLGKGRQMPVHYGSKDLNCHTIASPVGTQLPQAVGAAYRLKMQGLPSVAVAFFGDGTSSTNDFHSALNFAATLASPTLFICRNNGYAISTPAKDQYAGDGIVARAPGYGVAGIRVDGNDVFAVHAAVREAKNYALQHNAPVLIEAMTYRQGHHSTSDDSTRYRPKGEVDEFADRMDPLNRMNYFLKRHGFVTDEDVATIHKEERSAVLDAIQKAEHRPKPSMESLFEDVYKDMPPHLKDQLEQLKQHVAKFPEKY